MSRILPAFAILCACSAPPAPRRTSPTDKEAVFGDPGLLPTREGEWARRELALAGQVDAAVESLPGVQSARVDVALARDDRPTRATVTVVGRTNLDDDVRTLVRGIVGEVPADEVRVIAADEDAPESDPKLDLLFALALLGLGVSLGISVERVRALSRRL